VNIVNQIIRYEQGELLDTEIVELFQELIDTGLVFHLQGHYGRTALGLIESGLCNEKGDSECV
jgi:hypothetical protein